MRHAPTDEARPWPMAQASGLRVAFLGSAALNPVEAAFCARLGAALARLQHLSVATSGFAGRVDLGKRSFTGCITQAFVAGMAEAVIHRRVTTFVVRRADGTVPDNLVQIGRCVQVRGRSLMNRQAQIIARSDVLCVGGGGPGTLEFARLALQIDKPMLPLPFLDGASRDLWHEFTADIRTEFLIGDEQWRRWSSADLDSLPEDALDRLAAEVAETLVRCVRGTCVVCMPFAERFLPVYRDLIVPAASAARLQPIRTDHTPVVGDIMDALRTELEAASGVVAVLDERNPNVLYEVGYAHALRKPVVLMQAASRPGDNPPELPFDIRTHRVVRYPGDMAPAGVEQARSELQAVLRDLVND